MTENKSSIKRKRKIFEYHYHLDSIENWHRNHVVHAENKTKENFFEEKQQNFLQLNLNHHLHQLKSVDQHSEIWKFILSIMSYVFFSFHTSIIFAPDWSRCNDWPFELSVWLKSLFELRFSGSKICSSSCISIQVRMFVYLSMQQNH